VRLTVSPCSLTMCPPLIIWNRVVDFNKIQQRGHVIGDYLDTTFFNLVTLTIPKCRKFKLLRYKTCTSRCGSMTFWMLIDLQMKNNFWDHLSGKKSMNVEGGWKWKFIFCFMEVTYEPLELNKWSLVQRKIVHTPATFIWIANFIWRSF
jgi:hypothetical protein